LAEIELGKLFWEVETMKRYIISAIIILAVPALAYVAWGQGSAAAPQAEQRQNMRERLRNMSEEEKEKFMAEMLERRQKWDSMSEEEKEKFRAEMRDRAAFRPGGMGRSENRWHRERMGAGILWASVVAIMKMTCAGGSSKVFRSAPKASLVIWWASSIIKMR